MDDSDDNPSKHDSDFEKSDDENVSNVNAEDIELGACSSEDEIDDMTLFKSLKILRRISKSVNINIAHQGVRTRNQKHSAAGPSRTNRNTESAPSNPLSRCCHTYFRDIILSLDDHKKEIVSNHQFGFLLEFDGCAVPRKLVTWIADKIDENCNDISACGKIISLSPTAVHHLLGTPIGGNDINATGESGKVDFLNLFNVSSMPTIKTFGSKILSKEVMSDDQFMRCFMVVALSTFLCPNSSTFPSPKYLKPLIDVSSIGDWDWSKFIYGMLIRSIKKFKKKRSKTVGGCIYFLAVYYLDFLDFGTDLHIPRTIPRILVWKGSMVKKYSMYDSVGAGKFGKRPVLDISETCYALRASSDEQASSFRDSLELKFSYLPAAVKLLEFSNCQGFPQYIKQISMQVFVLLHGKGMHKQTSSCPHVQ